MFGDTALPVIIWEEGTVGAGKVEPAGSVAVYMPACCWKSSGRWKSLEERVPSGKSLWGLLEATGTQQSSWCSRGEREEGNARWVWISKGCVFPPLHCGEGAGL